MTAGKPPTREEMLAALSRYQKRGSVTYEVASMAQTLADESDRGVVVILGSLLEDLLLERLLERFVEMSNAERSNLTRAGGLLSNFDDRISLARALGMIDEEMTELLRVVKAMRNACAHSRLELTFETSELRDVLSLLFESENARDIRAGRNAVAMRIFFIVAFIYMSAKLRGETEEAAQLRSQRLMDTALVEAGAALVKHRQNLAQRRARRAANSEG